MISSPSGYDETAEENIGTQLDARRALPSGSRLNEPSTSRKRSAIHQIIPRAFGGIPADHRKTSSYDAPAASTAARLCCRRTQFPQQLHVRQHADPVLSAESHDIGLAQVLVERAEHFGLANQGRGNDRSWCQEPPASRTVATADMMHGLVEDRVGIGLRNAERFTLTGSLR